MGLRDTVAAKEFFHDLAGRFAHKVQLSTDGYAPYLEVAEESFGGQIDYGMLVKIYGGDEKKGQKRYSPAKLRATRKEQVSGTPDPKHISTGFVERQNLTMRMGM